MKEHYEMYEVRIRIEYDELNGSSQLVEKVNVYYLNDWLVNFLTTTPNVKYSVDNSARLRVDSIPGYEQQEFINKFVMLNEFPMNRPMYCYTLVYPADTVKEAYDLEGVDREERLLRFMETDYCQDIDHNQVDQDITDMLYIVEDSIRTKVLEPSQIEIYVQS